MWSNLYKPVPDVNAPWSVPVGRDSGYKQLFQRTLVVANMILCMLFIARATEGAVSGAACVPS